MVALLAVLALPDPSWANQSCGAHACPQKPVVGSHMTPDCGALPNGCWCSHFYNGHHQSRGIKQCT